MEAQRKVREGGPRPPLKGSCHASLPPTHSAIHCSKAEGINTPTAILTDFKYFWFRENEGVFHWITKGDYLHDFREVKIVTRVQTHPHLHYKRPQ